MCQPSPRPVEAPLLQRDQVTFARAEANGKIDLREQIKRFLMGLARDRRAPDAPCIPCRGRSVNFPILGKRTWCNGLDLQASCVGHRNSSNLLPRARIPRTQAVGSRAAASPQREFMQLSTCRLCQAEVASRAWRKLPSAKGGATERRTGAGAAETARKLFANCLESNKISYGPLVWPLTFFKGR